MKPRTTGPWAAFPELGERGLVRGFVTPSDEECPIAREALAVPYGRAICNNQ